MKTKSKDEQIATLTKKVEELQQNVANLDRTLIWHATGEDEFSLRGDHPYDPLVTIEKLGDDVEIHFSLVLDEVRQTATKFRLRIEPTACMGCGCEKADPQEVCPSCNHDGDRDRVVADGIRIASWLSRAWFRPRFLECVAAEKRRLKCLKSTL